MVPDACELLLLTGKIWYGIFVRSLKKFQDHGLVAGVGGLRGRPGTDRDAEWLILRTSEGTADRRARR